MKVSKHQRVGNLVENYIGFKLSEYCLVRHVSAGTDIGIDLYCELLSAEGDAVNHFWVQVKGSEFSETRILKNKQCSFKTTSNHLHYWHDQPVPVYLMFASREEILSETEFPKIWVANVTQQLLNGNITLNNSKCTSKNIQSELIIQSNDELKDFLESDVERTDSFQKIQYGVVSPLKSTSKRYIKSLPTFDITDFYDNVLTHMRFSSTTLLRQLIVKEIEAELNATDIFKSLRNKRRHFHCIVEALGTRHWEVPYSLGWSFFLDREFDKAKSHFELSLGYCEEDNRRRNKNDWEQQIANNKGILEYFSELESETIDLNKFLILSRKFIYPFDYLMATDDYTDLGEMIGFETTSGDL